MTTEYIRGLSHAKLAHSNQDLRKSVLISNTLQNVETIKKVEADDMLEQQWLNTCLDELHLHDEQQREPMTTEPPSFDTRQQAHATAGWRHDYRPHCFVAPTNTADDRAQPAIRQNPRLTA